MNRSFLFSVGLVLIPNGYNMDRCGPSLNPIPPFLRKIISLILTNGITTHMKTNAMGMSWKAKQG